MLSYPEIDPILLSLGPLKIRWYGLAYVAGLGLGFGLLKSELMKRFSLTQDQLLNIITATMLGILLGGRLGYSLFYNFPYYASNPLQLFAVWEGGMSFHGGAIGAMLAFVYYAKRYQLDVLQLLDFLGVGSTIGLFLGRLSNFINGELYGRVTDVPWAMVFPDGGPFPRHPSQLYEGFLEGIVLGGLLFYLLKRHRLKPGRLFSFFLFGYGAIRFFIEYVREPDPQLGLLWLSFTMGQWLSLVMIGFGIAITALINRKQT